MANNSNRNKKRRNKKKQINKAAGVPNTTSSQRSSKKQISTAAIEAVRHIVEILKPFELSKTQRLRTYQTMLMDDAIFALPLEGIIDVEQETARLNKEMEKTLEEIAKIDKQLSNENFVARAPEKVVQEKRTLRDEFLSVKSKLEEALQRLKGL